LSRIALEEDPNDNDKLKNYRSKINHLVKELKEDGYDANKFNLALDKILQTLEAEGGKITDEER
jgi:hypothetical protein